MILPSLPFMAQTPVGVKKITVTRADGTVEYVTVPVDAQGNEIKPNTSTQGKLVIVYLSIGILVLTMTAVVLFRQIKKS